MANEYELFEQELFEKTDRRRVDEVVDSTSLGLKWKKQPNSKQSGGEKQKQSRAGGPIKVSEEHKLMLESFEAQIADENLKSMIGQLKLALGVQKPTPTTTTAQQLQAADTEADGGHHRSLQKNISDQTISRTSRKLVTSTTTTVGDSSIPPPPPPRDPRRYGPNTESPVKRPLQPPEDPPPPPPPKKGKRQQAGGDDGKLNLEKDQLNLLQAAVSQLNAATSGTHGGHQGKPQSQAGASHPAAGSHGGPPIGAYDMVSVATYRTMPHRDHP